MWVLQLFLFFFKIVLATRGSWKFHKNLRTSFSISVKVTIRIFMEITINLLITLSSIAVIKNIVFHRVWNLFGRVRERQNETENESSRKRAGQHCGPLEPSDAGNSENQCRAHSDDLRIIPPTQKKLSFSPWTFFFFFNFLFI